jgi:leucyl-tRNA synthetase
MAEASVPKDVPKDAVTATIDLLKPQEAESKTLKIENTDKRDTLIEAEKRYQKAWQEQGVFNPDAPSLDEEPFDSTTPKMVRQLCLPIHERNPPRRPWFHCLQS